MPRSLETLAGKVHFALHRPCGLPGAHASRKRTNKFTFTVLELLPRLVLGLHSFNQALVIEGLRAILKVRGGKKGDKFIMPLLQLLAQFVLILAPEQAGMHGTAFRPAFWTVCAFDICRDRVASADDQGDRQQERSHGVWA